MTCSLEADKNVMLDCQKYEKVIEYELTASTDK